MFRRIASTALFVTLTTTVPVMASDEVGATTPATTSTVAAPRLVIPEAPAASPSSASVSAESMTLLVGGSKSAARGGVLPSLYVGLASLNAYDAYTTVKGLAAGAKETNGLMARATATPLAVWAIKGGVTAGSIFVSERLWRSHHRAEAIGMMVASNALMAAVGARNTSVLRNQH